MDGQEPGPLAQPTRARLFAAVRAAGGEVGTDELARAVGLHVNGVRRHLDLLQGAGLLVRERRRHGRGRPRDVWSVAAGADTAGGDPERPENYADVARWLARAIEPGPAALRRVEATGREVGRELEVSAGASLAEGIDRAFTDLGFAPAMRTEDDGVVCCELSNCPYRESVRENPDAVCRLHRGITEGLLDQLAPDSRLTRFEPHDPDEAGCMVEVAPAR